MARESEDGAGEFPGGEAPLFRSLPDPAVGYESRDPEPVIRAANPAFEDAFAPPDPVGRPLSAGLAGGDDGPDPADLADRIAAGEAVDAVVDHAVGSETRHFRCRSVPVEARPTPLDGYVVYADVTERERERRALDDRVERAESFMKVVTHDLRNPMEVARLRTKSARETGEVVHFEKALGAIERMDGIIESARAMILEEERLTTDSVDLEATVRSAWDAVDTGGATLAAGDLGAVRADRDYLRQLLENLFRNAVEHGSTSSRSPTDDSVEHGSTGSRSPTDDSVEHGSTGSRSPADDAAEREPGGRSGGGGSADRDADAADGLTVRVGRLDGGFYVADDGVGVPEQRRDRVFEPRYSTADDGTGYGLAIVARIAEAHGWAVDLGQSADGGARFEFVGVEPADAA